MQKLTERIDDAIYREVDTVQPESSLQSDQKRLYKSLERPIVSGTGPAPNQADTVAFCRSLWSEPVNHNVRVLVCGYYAHGPRHHNAG
ncbi:unnamed protein product [Parnassius apollo]|uniref:(apollo) hypothetical protein n=1 Tax=Parnassius apollo TaxID=110799 RepID=A0A8S3XXC9_PARAO|nr:unnamed protein product [Parnassius apollo]